MCLISSCASLFDENLKGQKQAELATSYFSQGNFEKAEQQAKLALRENPNQTQALLIEALVAEATARPNKARANYEQLILLNSNETTVLTTQDMIPVKVADVANKRLRFINIKDSEIIMEDIDGNKVFNIKKDRAMQQSKSAIEEALFVKESKNINNSKATTEANVKAIEILFSDGEKNTVSRFLILKELAENNLITKEEFLSARTTNLGGLLPLTNQAPAAGLNNSVPSPDVIIERINTLKDGLEDRSLSSKEFSAERNLIVEALLPTNPRARIAPKAPAKDILTAAKDLRKLEVLFELNLITSKEKDREKAAIEKSLGLNKPAPKQEIAPPLPPVAPAPILKEVEVTDKIMVEELSLSPSKLSKPTPATNDALPEVSSPF